MIATTSLSPPIAAPGRGGSLRALGALFVGAALVLAARLGRPGRVRRGDHQRGHGRQRSQTGSEERDREHVRRVVDTQVDAGERGVTGREGGVVGDRHQRPERRLGPRRARTLEHLLERGTGERRGGRRGSGGDLGQQGAPEPEIATEPEQQRSLHEKRGEQRLPQLLLVVNARASGIDDPGRVATELVAILDELQASADAVITSSEADLFEALRGALATRRRVVLVGGDGSLHGAANAPLGRLPELALVPAGRANNIARALRIPMDRTRALTVAAGARASPLDALRVETPERTVYALEAVSAGFQAQARSRYGADNSADLRQGVRALAHAIRQFAPFELRADLDGGELVSGKTAQLFLSNLPYFGFGFEVAPGADPADGRLEAILFEASGRGTLLRLLAAAYRGHHLEHHGVRRISTRRAKLTEPLPLVADAEPLGTTTAAVSVEPGRLRVAAPEPGGIA
jgi:diacylglycerol kinase (ATP)